MASGHERAGSGAAVRGRAGGYRRYGGYPESRLKLGVDPLGGSGIEYWKRIAEHYKLDLTIVNDHVDQTFRFMHLDKDGAIRMDCSSECAMAGLLALRDKFDLAFANDPDYDRHGIVTPAGLMNPNHYRLWQSTTCSSIVHSGAKRWL